MAETRGSPFEIELESSEETVEATVLLKSACRVPTMVHKTSVGSKIDATESHWSQLRTGARPDQDVLTCHSAHAELQHLQRQSEKS